MTAMEFSRKYDVDYSIVHSAKHKTQTRKRRGYAASEYPEEELYQATQEYLMKQIELCTEKLQKYNRELVRMNEIRENAW